MKNIHFIIIILLAVFLTPSDAFACGKSNSEMKCCNKEISSNTNKKACCQKKTSKEKQAGCNGKCGQALCSVSAGYSAIASLVSFDIIHDNFNFSSTKHLFYQSESITSDGYSSIWLIPKIS